MSTRKDVAEVVAKMSAAYPNWNPNEFTIQVYFEDLQDIDGELLKLAADYCRTEPGRKFAPSTGELRGAVADLQGRSNNVPLPGEAWQEVITQITENGGDFGRPVWSHPLVEKTVRALGWVNLRMSENSMADRARFLEIYETYAERAKRDTVTLPQVAGYIQANGGKLLTAPEGIKLLADKLSVKK